jgi:hypothetical protein
MEKFKKLETRAKVAILNDFKNQQLGHGGGGFIGAGKGDV